MITIKDYAEAHGVTSQSVYQQLLRPKNKEALKDHIKTDESGTKLLDDFAVEYLSSKSLKKSGTSVIIQNDSELALQIRDQEKEIARLNALVASINNDYLQQLNDVREESSKKIEELRESKELLLKENKEAAVKLTESEANVKLKDQENQHLQEQLKADQERIEELLKAQQELQIEANKKWWQKLFG